MSGGRRKLVDPELREYLVEFTRVARDAGLDMYEPGKNWARARDIVPGSHISLSVRRTRIQVNLNNERDDDRRRFGALFADRREIEIALGADITWEQKEGRRKTAVRVALEEGLDGTDWPSQHSWAVERMRAFTDEFEPRLRRVIA